MNTFSVDIIQAFLNRYGYLKLDHHSNEHCIGTCPQAKVGQWDDASQVAFQKYQEMNGLPLTPYIGDEGTMLRMCERRCNLPDRPYQINDALQQTQRWNKTVLKWKLLNYTPDMNQYEVSQAFNKGFQMWAAVTPLVFIEALRDEQADINITFKKLDSVGNVLAQAWFPPVGRMEFDESETWSWSLPLQRGQVDLATIVCHEAGHALGLDHSNVRGAMMAPVYAGPMRYLSNDDIQRIQRLYPR